MGRTFLIVQSAFTGDVILATSLIEKLHAADENNRIDILVRKGNESLLDHNPFINEILIWDKKKDKYKNLLQLIFRIREKKYYAVINLQRFSSTGILTAFSSAHKKIGFNKNPFSFLYSHRIKHVVKKGIHEIDRNQLLIDSFAPGRPEKPRLYPSIENFISVKPLKHREFITIAPSSVWFTKTFPAYKWMELINHHRLKKPSLLIYLLGSKGEFAHSEYVKNISGNQDIINLCGTLSFLESAALMKDALMNFTNDSAPLHMAGAVNAPVTAIYCSTIPDFGFGPLSDISKIIETSQILNCRPCGIHGYMECPLTHFKCAHTIDVTNAVEL